MTFDGAILLWIQENVRCKFLSSIFIPFTHLGDAALIWFFIILLLLISKKNRRAAVLGFVALGLGFLFCEFGLKLLINRPRPFDVMPDLVSLIKRPTGSSCPSGHTSTAFAFATVVFMNTKKRWSIPVLVLALIMGFTRMYVGVHYPTDVLGGCLLGITVGILVSILGNKIIKKIYKMNGE